MLFHHYLACELPYVHLIHLVDVVVPISHPAFRQLNGFPKGLGSKHFHTHGCLCLKSPRKVPIRTFCGHPITLLASVVSLKEYSQAHESFAI
jgi:hypothetical protein